MSQRSTTVVGLSIVSAVQLFLLVLILLREPTPPLVPDTGPSVDVDLTPVLDALEQVRGDLKGRPSARERATVEGKEPQHDALLEAIEQLRERLSRDVAAIEIAAGQFASDVSETAKLFPVTNVVAVKEFAQLYERDEDAARSTVLLRTMPEILTRFGSPTAVMGGRAIRLEYDVEIAGSKYSSEFTFNDGLVIKLSGRVREGE